MKKILISWITPVADFLIQDNSLQVNTNGPNAEIHALPDYNYDEHVLLYSPSAIKYTKLNQPDRNLTTEQANKLLQGLHKINHEHKITLLKLQIDDPVDVVEIVDKTKDLLLQYSRDQIDIFVSAGTPSMQTAWYINHFALKLQTMLFLMRPPHIRGEHKEAKREYVHLQQDRFPSMIRNMSESLIGNNNDKHLITPTLRKVYDQALKASRVPNQIPIFIAGKTGTGKEYLANYIHRSSKPKEAKFLPVNCSSLTETLLETRLFGYTKGAFTDAKEKRDGFFKSAGNGSLFMDEIGDISPFMQQSLLRVIQEREYYPVGENAKTEKLGDLRIIVATHADLRQRCKEGTFRWDLYYRITPVVIRLPDFKDLPKDEREQFIHFILKHKNKEFGLEIKFENRLIKELLNAPFAGNIRELEHVIIHLCIAAADEGVATIEHLPGDFYDIEPEYSLKLEDVEKLHIKKVLEMAANVNDAAKKLGISHATVNAKIEAYELQKYKPK